MLLFLIGLGFLFIILIMVFFINPPELWIKRFVHRQRKERNENDKG